MQDGFSLDPQPNDRRTILGQKRQPHAISLQLEHFVIILPPAHFE